MWVHTVFGETDSSLRSLGGLIGPAAPGLLAGLAGLILATTLHQTSHALAVATLFLVFTAGIPAQLETTRLPASRVLAFGAISMIVGLVLLVVAVRLSSTKPGAVDDRRRVDRRGCRGAVITVFVGLSVPVIGAYRIAGPARACGQLTVRNSGGGP